MTRLYGTAALLLPILFTLAALIAGADWLTSPTPGWPALPLGNLATWAGLVGLTLATLWWSPPGWMTWLGILGVLLALAWGPIGRWLSGNWAFSFSGGNLGGWWLNGSLVLGVALLLAFKAAIFTTLFRALRSAGESAADRP